MCVQGLLLDREGGLYACSKQVAGREQAVYFWHGCMFLWVAVVQMEESLFALCPFARGRWQMCVRAMDGCATAGGSMWVLFFAGGLSGVSACDVTKKGHMLVVVVMVNSGGGGNGEEAGWWWSQTIVRESVCRARQVVGSV